MDAGIDCAGPNKLMRPVLNPIAAGAKSPLLMVALMMAQVGQALTFVILSGVLPQIAAHFGSGGELIAQQMNALPFLGIALGGLLAVWVIGRLGLRGTIVAGAGLFTVAGSVPFWADGAHPLLAGSFLLGIGAALVVGAMAGMVAELYEGSMVPRIISLQVAVGIFASAAVALAMAFAAEHQGWRVPFLGYVIAGAATLLLSLIALPTGTARRAETVNFPSLVRHGAGAFVLGFLAFLGLTAHPIFTPFLMEQKGVVSPLHRQLYMTVSPIVGFFGSLSYALLQGRIPSRLLSAAAVVGVAGGLSIFAIWKGAPGEMLLGLTVFGVGFGLAIAALYAAAAAANPEQSGQSVSVMNSAMLLGASATPIALSPLRAALGIQTTYLALAAFVVVIGFLAQFLAFTKVRPEGVRMDDRV